jgi:hypothetical protein
MPPTPMFQFLLGPPSVTQSEKDALHKIKKNQKKVSHFLILWRAFLSFWVAEGEHCKTNGRLGDIAKIMVVRGG